MHKVFISYAITKTTNGTRTNWCVSGAEGNAILVEQVRRHW